MPANVHIHTFRKRLSLTWGCVFPASILNNRNHFKGDFFIFFKALENWHIPEAVAFMDTYEKTDFLKDDTYYRKLF